MSGPAVAFLAIDLIATAAVVAFLIAFVRQGRRLADAARRFAEAVGPTLDAIGRGATARGR